MKAFHQTAALAGLPALFVNGTRVSSWTHISRRITLGWALEERLTAFATEDPIVIAASRIRAHLTNLVLKLNWFDRDYRHWWILQLKVGINDLLCWLMLDLLLLLKQSWIFALIQFIWKLVETAIVGQAGLATILVRRRTQQGWRWRLRAWWWIYRIWNRN